MGKYDYMKKWTYIPIMSIVIGELLIFYDKIPAGIGIHMISLLAIILIIVFGNLSLNIKNILQSMTLLPLSRIVSLQPLSDNIYKQHLIMYGIMLVPIYLIMKNQCVLHKESATKLSILLKRPPSFERVSIYIPAVILTIVMIVMIVQYIGIIPDLQIITPDITKEFSILLIIILSISLLVADTKYWNEYISNSINICSTPLLLTFMAMMIHQIMMQIKI